MEVLLVYCRCCGQVVVDIAGVCISCGADPVSGELYCHQCGQETETGAEVCAKCGQSLPAPPKKGKDWLVALLLCIFLGGMGIHRFYTGHFLVGVVQLFTLGGFGIWALIDLVRIISGSYQDKKGNLLVKR
jgi:TM2 domain-containing membrane protein YozV